MTFDVKKINVDADDYEQLGTKEKFWFRFKGGNVKWIFKYSRGNTGEHWAEKIAEELCKALGIPHVKYEMASMNNRMAVVSPNVVPDSCRMIMGNEVLHKNSPSNYPEPVTGEQQFVRVKEHTINRVLGCLDISEVLPPKDWEVSIALNAGDIFCGYILLDALISNQDRHHENWAIIIDTQTKKKYLCETYDHAASLGRELLDTEREERLKTNDRNRTISTFVRKARCELFRLKTDTKPMYTVDAFFEAVKNRNDAKKYWLNKLQELTDDTIEEIFSKIPNVVISDVAKQFAFQMVLENKKRLLSND